jgi:ribonuclease P protein subunit POP4
VLRHRRWNLAFHELIGLRVRVLVYPDSKLKGVEGLVVDETSETLVVGVHGRKLRLLKRNALFEFTLPDGSRVVLRGEDIIGAPAERVKRLEKARGVSKLVASAKHRYTWAEATRKSMR